MNVCGKANVFQVKLPVVKNFLTPIYYEFLRLINLMQFQVWLYINSFVVQSQTAYTKQLTKWHTAHKA
jgi:hypothetical protein